MGHLEYSRKVEVLFDLPQSAVLAASPVDPYDNSLI